MHRPRPRPTLPHPPNPLDDGPLGPTFLALRAAGAGPREEILAAEALGVPAPALARMVHLHAAWLAREESPGAGARARLAVALLREPGPVLFHLLEPEEAWRLGLSDGDLRPLLDSVHPLPPRLAEGRTGPRGFVLGPGTEVDLGWCRDLDLDLEVTGPLEGWRPPGGPRVLSRLRLRGMDLPPALAPQRFLKAPADLVVEDCTGLNRLSGCSGLRTATLRRCPDLERVDLSTHDLADLRIEDCPRLTLVRFGRGDRGPATAPALTLLDCPGLTGAGLNPGLRRDLFLRSLRVEGCPAFGAPSAHHRLPAAHARG